MKCKMSTVMRDESAARTARSRPRLMMINMMSGVRTVRQGMDFLTDPKIVGGRIYSIPDAEKWRTTATRYSWLFQWTYGRELRQLSDEFKNSFGRNARVVLLVHRANLIDLVCCVARVLISHGEVKREEISILYLEPWLPSEPWRAHIKERVKKHGLSPEMVSSSSEGAL